MYQIIITVSAEQDIKQAVNYIAEELQNPIAAKRLLDNATIAISTLEELPSRHALTKEDDLAKRGVRLFPVDDYLVFYVVREKTQTVVIERFLHGRRDWAAIL